MAGFYKFWAIALFLFLQTLSAQAEERQWVGPAVELRFGAGQSGYEFAGSDGRESVAASAEHSHDVVGVKLSWRIPLGQRLRFGSTVGLYTGGTDFSFSGEYLPEGISGQVHYRQHLSATVGLQIGLDLGRGWYAYGEGGLVGERARLDVGVTQGVLSASYEDTGYLLGEYAEVGVAKALDRNTYVIIGYQIRKFNFRDWTEGAGRAIDLDIEGFQVGLGWRF